MPAETGSSRRGASRLPKLVAGAKAKGGDRVLCPCGDDAVGRGARGRRREREEGGSVGRDEGAAQEWNEREKNQGKRDGDLALGG